MKLEEAIVYQWLVNDGHEAIEFEPYGNTMPDFVVNRDIAIEVRRLNKQKAKDANGNIFRGLEESRKPILDSVEELLRQYDRFYTGTTFFFELSIRRPLPKLSVIKKTIESFLETRVGGVFLLSDKYHLIPECLSLELMHTSVSQPGKLFRLGSLNDSDVGGWTLHDLLANLERSIAEKSRKLLKNCNHVRHPSWWLAFVNMISYEITADLDRAIRSSNLEKGPWERIVLINPVNPRNSFCL